jgi:hypothetical protein
VAERLSGFGLPVIVVIDYAESRADLVAVLQRVAALAASTGPRVRVLLLARNDGDWWKSLPNRNPELAVLLDGRTSIQLSPLAATPADVFAEVVQAFARSRQRPMSSIIADVRFSRVLRRAR